MFSVITSLFLFIPDSAWFSAFSFLTFKKIVDHVYSCVLIYFFLEASYPFIIIFTKIFMFIFIGL